MRVNEYQAEALRTVNRRSIPLVLNPNLALLLEGTMGLAGEAGECLDIMKKYLFQGHKIDKEHLVKELGDVSWYLAVTAYVLGYDLEKVFRLNVDKLRKRYPDGFASERSTNRKEGDV